VPLQRRYEIFDRAMKAHQRIKQDNIGLQNDLVKRINDNIKDKHLMSPDLE